MSRVYNFSAGPSMLPEPVLQKAAAEMMDYQGSGQSVMEMSHRSKVFDAIYQETQALWREVMDIPENYKVLFMQGGASTQFAAVPMNLMTKSGKADYVLSGQFSTKAYKEAARYGDCKVVGSSKEDNFSHIPLLDPKEFRPDADYFHICLNNTIYGTVWKELPGTGNVPLVAMEGTPTMFNYKVMADNDSMYNTPPCWPIYISKLVLEWIKNDIGGLEKMEERNVRKAQLLYDFLDQSTLFKGCADKDSRSIMNVTFVTGDKDLDAKFVKESEAAGFVNLKGHRSVGGMRASIYNAMPEEGIVELVEFMKKFELENK